MSDKKTIFDSTIPNDQIDIYAEPSVKIKVLKSDNDKELKIELEGLNIDNSVANALRRTILMSIPIYAFHRSNTYIEVERSRHMYNNDFLYNQIETLPIYDIPNHFDLEDPEVFLPTEIMKHLFGKFVPEKYTEETEEEKKVVDLDKKLFKIELFINVKNNTDDYKFVSTHDAVLKIDGKVSNSYKIRRPISILVLKPTEEIALRTEANLGISAMHAAYEATTIAVCDDISPTKYQLWYETLEQLDKHVIFAKACVILSKKFEYLNKFIKNKYTEEHPKSETIELQLYGENHTVGNLLATILQKCEYVEKAGYSMQHPFIDQITVAYKLFPKAKIGPIQVFTDCINYLIKLFVHIGNVHKSVLSVSKK